MGYAIVLQFPLLMQGRYRQKTDALDLFLFFWHGFLNALLSVAIELSLSYWIYMIII